MKSSKMVLSRVLVALAAAWIALPVAAADAAPQPRDRDVERGEYLVMIGGCNDCHTPNYLARGPRTAADVILTGSKVGWRGPWGTTYAPNLRIYFQELTEAEWAFMAKSIERRPPMPFYSLNSMSEGDARAIYRYIRSLGPAGVRAPAFVPPDKVPPRPYSPYPASLH
jgi:mono/diheme cytochrome c family protein